ncbi:MAG: cytochrome-c peroxidase, partial [Leucothrix sp.]
MLNRLTISTLFTLCFGLTACGGGGNGGTGTTNDSTLNTNAALLGERLFSDTRLSFSQTQSCATCHNPDKGFIDDRDNGIAGAVSLGHDQITLGNRNSPTVAYASLTPDFIGNNQNARGGQFLDGRASNLTDQAGQPLLNPAEMGMPDRASVIERLVAVPEYVAAFEAIYGVDVLVNTETAFA